MKTIYRTGLVVFSSVVLASLILLALLFYSTKFNRWLVLQAVGSIPELSIGKVDGFILSGLQLQELSYHTEQLELNIDTINYRYKLADLLKKRILFESMYVDGVDIMLFEGAKPAKQDGSAITFKMPIAMELSKLSLHDVNIQKNEAQYQFDEISLTLLYQKQSLQISQFALVSELIQLQGDAELKLESQLPFNGHLTLIKTVPDYAEVKAQVSVQGDRQKIYLDADLQLPGKAHGQGWIELNEVAPYFDLQVAWSSLQWPFQGTKQYASENSQLTLQGTPEQYHIQLDSTLYAKGVSTGLLHLIALGDMQQLTINDLTIKADAGDIRSKGRISWTENMTSDIQLWANNIRLDSVWPDYSSELSLEAQLTGALFNKPNIHLNIKRLHGHLLNKAVEATAKIHYLPTSTNIEYMSANVGINHFNTQGQLGDNNQLVFTLEAADLHALSPDLTGSVFANGRLEGNFNQPLIELSMHSEGLGFKQQTVGAIQLTAKVVPTRDGELDLALKAQRIVLDGITIKTLELGSTGTLAQHQVALKINSTKGQTEIELQGTWEPQKYWQGQLQQVQLLNTFVGHWQLIQAAPLKILFAEPDSVKLLTKLCLAQKGATGLICANAQIDPQAGQTLEGTIKQLPLSVLTKWLPEKLQIDSHLNAEFSLLIQPGLQGSINARLDPGVIRVTTEESGLQSIPFEVAQVKAEITSANIQTELSMVLDKHKRLDGQMDISGLDNLETATINGVLNAEVDSIDFVNAFSDSVSNIKGEIDAKVQLHGLLQAPLLDGSKVRLSRAQLSVVEGGLTVNNIDFEIIDKQNQRLAVRGNAEINGQKINLKGQVESYASEQLQFDLAVNGENLQVLQLPDMQAWVSPDLHFTGNKKGAKLQGDVIVPKALILIASLPEEAVALSDDEVVISDEKVEHKEAAYPISMDINVLLGDAVSIEGFGLKSRLKGQLNAVLEKNHFKLFNALNLVDGTYQAYGQDLTIEKGVLLFAGDVENTGVSVLASRKASDWNDKTIAYLNMSGMLKAPVTRIYTEPSLNESESLAYLLTGGPLSNSGGSSAGMLAKAALGLGRDYVDAVIGAVGVDEFDIKSTALGQNSMVVGKRIAPNLYARYIVDILSSQMQFAVEYKWSKNISIETRAGSTHSSDIKYNIEF